MELDVLYLLVGGIWNELSSTPALQVATSEVYTLSIISLSKSLELVFLLNLALFTIVSE